MATKTYDAIVIGAGPAGAATSRKLVKGGMKTLLIEKKKLPRRKMCSGLLSRWTVDFVHRNFGPIPPEAHAEIPFLKGIGLNYPSIPETIEIPARDPIPYIERHPFDYFLARASGAEIKDGMRMDRIEPVKDKFKVLCRRSLKGGKTSQVTLQAKYVVAADGSNSRAVRCMLPDVQRGMPYCTGIQKHYLGKIDLDPYLFHGFFHLGVGFYAWANMKGERIVAGVSGLYHRKAVHYMDSFLSLLKQNYGFKIKKTVLEEAMAGYMLGPLNKFALGRGNFLVAGDAAGFIHNGGEGISAGLVSGEQAGEAILRAETTDGKALGFYSRFIQDEVNLCLDQTNPLRMFKEMPMKLDFKSILTKYGLRNIFLMAGDLKAFGAQDLGLSETGIGAVSKQNMIHRLIHGRYPIEL